MSSNIRHHPGLNFGSTDAEAHEHARETLFGFWIFLMSDLVIFAMLFATYADMSVHGLAGGPGTRDIFSLRGSFIETMLLLTSSFTFGMASLALKYRADRLRLAAWLVVTLLLGAGFVGHEVHELWKLATADNAPPQRSGFLSAYYLLVGTHGAHVSAGMIWIVHSLVQLRVCGLVRDVKLRILRLSLFWHMLDVVWIGIFSFVYLFGLVR